MNDLQHAIVTNIADFEQKLWFPKLTPLLVQDEWGKLALQNGLNRTNYTTLKILNDPNKVELHNSYVLSNNISVYEVPDSLESSFRNGRSYTSAQIRDSNALTCLEAAFKILSQQESIATTINSLIVNLHLIKTDDDGYDISFSLPQIPFSAFVSVPSIPMKNDAFRVAEGIIHESMHLQLTLIDKITPLVKEGFNQSYFSPWKNEFRHPAGLLHALYVFGVILEFLYKIKDSSENEKYRSTRIKEIKTQIQSVSAFKNFDGFTEVGQALIERIFAE